MRTFSSDTSSEILATLVDEDTQGDISFWLWATATYCFLRIGLEVAIPGKHRENTYQQYVVTLAHQAVLLPALGLGWKLGLFEQQGPSYIYLCTGAYMISDSAINYSPGAKQHPASCFVKSEIFRATY